MGALHCGLPSWQAITTPGQAPHWLDSPAHSTLVSPLKSSTLPLQSLSKPSHFSTSGRGALHSLNPAAVHLRMP